MGENPGRIADEKFPRTTTRKIKGFEVEALLTDCQQVT
jgi:hypothetical protein